MPDITMCNNDKCPLSEHCKRHPDSGTVSGEHQSWCEFPYDRLNCEHFIDKRKANGDNYHNYPD